MKRLTTKVTYKVPIGPYCNHTMQKSTPLTRCRFCTDLGKYGFTCVLHNEQLAVLGGKLISKCEACFSQQGIVSDTPTVEPKEIIKFAISEYRRIYKELVKQGFPEPIADKIAQEEVLK
jgi:hypothetical protein